MCCVWTAYQWRMDYAHVAHMTHEWRCHCVWCRVGEPDNCVSTAQVAYAQRTSNSPCTRWSMSVHLTYARRSTRFYGVWLAYVQRMGCVHAKLINTSHYILVVTLANVWAVNVTFRWPIQYQNVQFKLSNLISHVHHRNDVVLISGRMIG